MVLEVVVIKAAEEPQSTSNTEEEAFGRFRAEDVAKALATLNPMQKRVLLLRYMLELTVGETAQVLGITAGTVERIEEGAINKLRTRCGWLRVWQET